MRLIDRVIDRLVPGKRARAGGCKDVYSYCRGTTLVVEVWCLGPDATWHRAADELYKNSC